MKSDDDRSEEVIRSQIQQLLTSLEMTGRAILPTTNEPLLQLIVEAAGRIFNAAAASILLINENEQVLEFKVAFGNSNRDLVGMKFPMDKGIAGYVVMTGQPLSVSNVRQDPRFNQDFAKTTGYVPNSILATPLMVDDRVIGVMEVLDKVNAASFGMQDMEILDIFARQAAIAINQFQCVDTLSDTFLLGLKRIVVHETNPPLQKLSDTLDHVTAFNSSTDLLTLSDLFREIRLLGDTERNLCLQILTAFAAYRQNLPRSRV